MDEKYRGIVQGVETSCLAKISGLREPLRSERQSHSDALDRLRAVHRRALRRLCKANEFEQDRVRELHESEIRRLEHVIRDGVGAEVGQQFDYVRIRQAWLLAENRVSYLQSALSSMDETLPSGYVDACHPPAQYPVDYPSPRSPYIVRPTS